MPRETSAAWSVLTFRSAEESELSPISNHSPEEIKAAVAECINILFGPGINLNSFLPSQAGKDGKASFGYFNSLSDSDKSATVTNNTRDHSARFLGNLNAYILSGGSQTEGHPLSGLTIMQTVNVSFGGDKMTLGPYTNYTANNVNSASALFPGLDAAVGAFVSTQIHELGNSIRAITGRSVGRPGIPDPAPGYQLEGCASQKLAGGM